MAEWQRTHTCGELRETHIGQIITLNGWVNTYRGHNNQVFVDLRDRYGLTQVVLDTDIKEIAEIARSIGREHVLSVRGEVLPRLTGKDNPKLATGKIEVKALSVRVLNGCPTPPFESSEPRLVDEQALGPGVAGVGPPRPDAVGPGRRQGGVPAAGLLVAVAAVRRVPRVLRAS